MEENFCFIDPEKAIQKINRETEFLINRIYEILTSSTEIEPTELKEISAEIYEHKDNYYRLIQMAELFDWLEILPPPEWKELNEFDIPENFIDKVYSLKNDYDFYEKYNVNPDNKIPVYSIFTSLEKMLYEKYPNIETKAVSNEILEKKAERKKPGPKPKKEAGKLSASRMAFLFSTLVTCKAFPMGSKLSMSNLLNFLTDLDPTYARDNFQETDLNFDHEGRELMIDILKEAIEKIKDKNFKGLEIVQ